jgi:hypothetical protein
MSDREDHGTAQEFGEPFAVYRDESAAPNVIVLVGLLLFVASLLAGYQGLRNDAHPRSLLMPAWAWATLGAILLSGALLGFYKGWIALSAISLVYVLMCAVFFVDHRDLSDPNTRRSSVEVTTIWLLSAANLFVFAVVAIFQGLLQLGHRYLLCQDGLVRKRGRSVDTMPWEGLQVFVNYRPDAPGGFDTLRLENGDVTWELRNNVANLADLFEKVNESIATVERDFLLEKIQDGKVATFGPMAISRNGVTLNGRKLAWDDVGAIEDIAAETETIPNRWFTITLARDSSEWGAIESQLVPNHELLFDLIHEIRPQVLANGE